MRSARLKSDPLDSAVTLVRECPVCLSPLDGSCSMRRLPCGHMFCLRCCVDHIVARLAARTATGTSVCLNLALTLLTLSYSSFPPFLSPLDSLSLSSSIPFPSPSFLPSAIECLQCQRLLDLETVQSMLQDRAEDSARYLRFALSDYVVSHPLLRWCPGPNCTIVFQVTEHQAKKVSCSKCSTTCWSVLCIATDIPVSLLFPV